MKLSAMTYSPGPAPLRRSGSPTFAARQKSDSLPRSHRWGKKLFIAGAFGLLLSGITATVIENNKEKAPGIQKYADYARIPGFASLASFFSGLALAVVGARQIHRKLDEAEQAAEKPQSVS